MPENRNRLRPKQIKFFVNDKEYELIRKMLFINKASSGLQFLDI